jgi:hypothetical protein
VSPSCPRTSSLPAASVESVPKSLAIHNQNKGLFQGQKLLTREMLNYLLYFIITSY